MPPEPDPEPLAGAALFDRFARFYDGDYRDYEDDLGMILDLAGEQAGPVLELGCGTGRVLLPLVDAGHEVTGVDVSPALLDVARRKLQAMRYEDRAELVQANFLEVDLPEGAFQFAVCTSNTLMHLNTLDEQLRLMQRTCGWLAAGGLFLIDLFAPDVPRLLEVNGLQELADTRPDDETGATVLKWSIRRASIAEQLQETTFIYEENFPDGTNRRTICPFTLRWLWASEATLMLRMAGFTNLEVYGDFDGAPYDDASEHLILLARKPSAF